jgi:F-type H+-transporting ATPase subunit b
MPQIDQIGSIYASQLLWLLLVFAIIYVVIGRGMLPRIEGTIHARNDKIGGDLATAQQARDEAGTVSKAYTAEMDSAHQGAAAAIQSAKDAVARETETRLKDSQIGIAAKLDAAEAALSAARTRALGEIEGVAAQATQDIVRRLAGLTVAESEAAAAVRAQFAGA